MALLDKYITDCGEEENKNLGEITVWQELTFLTDTTFSAINHNLTTKISVKYVFST